MCNVKYFKTIVSADVPKKTTHTMTDIVVSYSYRILKINVFNKRERIPWIFYFYRRKETIINKHAPR